MAFGSPVVSTQTVDSSTWTGIKLAKDSSIIKLINSSGQMLKLRSDSADANTEFQMVDGEVYNFETPPLGKIYRVQDILFYAQIGTGSSSIKVIAI